MRVKCMQTALKQINDKENIVFVTGYPEYDANSYRIKTSD